MTLSQKWRAMTFEFSDILCIHTDVPPHTHTHISVCVYVSFITDLLLGFYITCISWMWLCVLAARVYEIELSGVKSSGYSFLRDQSWIETQKFCNQNIQEHPNFTPRIYSSAASQFPSLWRFFFLFLHSNHISCWFCFFYSHFPRVYFALVEVQTNSKSNKRNSAIDAETFDVRIFVLIYHICEMSLIANVHVRCMKTKQNKTHAREREGRQCDWIYTKNQTCGAMVYMRLTLFFCSYFTSTCRYG